LTVTFPNTHAMAVDNQDNVLEVRPVTHVGLLAEVDALAFPAVIALNEAHGILVNAGAVTRPPPSDQWYRLIEQLTEHRRLSGETSMPSFAGDDAADLKQGKRRLYVGAAAFLVAEAHHLEDHCAALADNAAQTAIRGLSQIADQARAAADALLQRAERMSDSLPPPSSPGRSWLSVTQILPTTAGSRRRSIRPWFITAGLVAFVTVYGLVKIFTIASLSRDLIVALPFVVISGAVVFKWYLQAR
jgi:hypothetical protein